MTNWLAKANALDEDDPLKHLRERFNIPLAKNTCDNSKIEDDRKCIYLNGNSLGCMPKTASEETKKVLDNWKVHGMHCHFSGFFTSCIVRRMADSSDGKNCWSSRGRDLLDERTQC